MTRFPQQFEVDGTRYRLSFTARGKGHYELRVGDRRFDVHAEKLDESGGYSFAGPDGTRHFVHATLSSGALEIRLDGRTWILQSAERAHEHATAGIDSSRVVAPMTGTIVKVLVDAGQAVRAEDELVVLSAMKMEHRLRAQRSGTIEAVLCDEGTTVDPGTLLVRFEDEEGPQTD
ncbi:MAG: acetyl-CoA carboxylase biotin carboxyl carrier protein subunit [Planctomycetota bacterium]